MSDCSEKIKVDLRELVAWLERCRHHVDFLRDRIGNDFPAEMIEQTVPPSFAYNADGILESVAEEIDEMIDRLRKTTRKTVSELHASWSWQQKESGPPVKG